MASNQPLKTVVMVGIHAGCRLKSEALTLTWENVDLLRKTITVEGRFAKNISNQGDPDQFGFAWGAFGTPRGIQV